MRLRMIESKIEHVIYRLNKKTQANPALIQGFLDQLTAWKEAIPLEYYEHSEVKQGPFSGIDAFVSASKDWFTCAPLTFTADSVLQMCSTATVLTTFEKRS